MGFNGYPFGIVFDLIRQESYWPVNYGFTDSSFSSKRETPWILLNADLGFWMADWDGAGMRFEVSGLTYGKN
jgi:hypothetical protein